MIRREFRELHMPGGRLDDQLQSLKLETFPEPEEGCFLPHLDVFQLLKLGCFPRLLANVPVSFEEVTSLPALTSGCAEPCPGLQALWQLTEFTTIHTRIVYLCECNVMLVCAGVSHEALTTQRMVGCKVSTVENPS